MDHYSPKQVAERLGVSESSVKRWLDQGVVPVLRTAGGHRRVSEESVEELLRQLKTTSGFPRLSPVGGDASSQNAPAPRDNRDRGDFASERSASPSPSSLSPANLASGTAFPAVAPAGAAPFSEPKGQSGRMAEFAPTGYESSGQESSGQHLGPAQLKEISDRFSDALLHGRHPDCIRQIDLLVALGFPLATAADLLLTPAMHRLGERWECGEAAVYQERRACNIALELIHRLKQRLSASIEGPVAIGGSPQGDHYQLPTALVELALCERGWRATSLGSNLPLFDFLKAVQEYQPRVVWFSISHVDDEDALVEDFNRLATSLPKQTALLIGGRGATDSIRPRLRYTGHCDSLRNLADLADSLIQRH